MEEFDDLLQKPDDNGVLDMSHRAWVTLDETIWTWYAALACYVCGSKLTLWTRHGSSPNHTHTQGCNINGA